MSPWLIVVGAVIWVVVLVFALALAKAAGRDSR